ncbi:MAG: hypothetical protein ACOYL3_04560 [Desulfuromonadaceae bacterium]
MNRRVSYRTNRFLWAFFLVCSFITLGIHAASAMDGGSYTQFQQIMMLPLDKQTVRANALLKKKYETTTDTASYENYMGYAIPFFVMTNDASLAAYRIAAVNPKLLSRYDVYDDCNGEKPLNLLACFLKEGKPGAYIDTGASCPVCNGEAISVFLWDDMGASQGQIVGGLRFLYDPSLRESSGMSP